MSANKTESGVGNDGRSWYSQETPSRLNHQATVCMCWVGEEVVVGRSRLEEEGWS